MIMEIISITWYDIVLLIFFDMVSRIDIAGFDVICFYVILGLVCVFCVF